MQITINTENRTIKYSIRVPPTAGDIHQTTYAVGSPMATAIRLVEKLLKIHIKTRAQADYITERTR